jgi:hypothetical protein
MTLLPIPHNEEPSVSQHCSRAVFWRTLLPLLAVFWLSVIVALVAVL